LSAHNHPEDPGAGFQTRGSGIGELDRGRARPPREETGPVGEPQTGQDKTVPAVAEISREIVRLHSRLYGRGPTRAKTIWRDDIVTCILEDVFAKAEIVLAESGRFEQVRSNRQVFNDEVAPQMQEIVEAATGRRVKSSLSQIAPAGVVAEVFLLH
jgi:uncharacterized protein YbcI